MSRWSILGEKWDVSITTIESQISTKSGNEGNRALETPKEAQSAGVPANLVQTWHIKKKKFKKKIAWNLRNGELLKKYIHGDFYGKTWKNELDKQCVLPVAGRIIDGSLS